MGEVLDVPDGGLSHQGEDQDAGGPADPFGDVHGMEGHGQGQGDPDQEQGQAGVQLGHVPKGHRDPLGPELACGRPGVGTGPGGGGSGGQDDGQQQDQGPAEEQDGPADQQMARAGGVVPARPVEEDDGVHHQRHGGQEMDHDQVRVQLRVDDDAAHDGLEQDATDQAGAQPDQVAAERPAAEGGQERGGDHDDEEHRDHPVPELHQGMELERRGEVVAGAVGPVRAAEPGPGEADGRPGDDDQDRHDQGGDAEPTEGGRRHRRQLEPGSGHSGSWYRPPPPVAQTAPGSAAWYRKGPGP